MDCLGFLKKKRPIAELCFPVKKIMNRDIKNIKLVFNLRCQTLSVTEDSQTNHLEISSVSMKRGTLHSFLLTNGWKIDDKKKHKQR